MKQANEERFVMVQIEDPEPLDDLEAIAALPGIDMIFFGPADFSQGIRARAVGPPADHRDTKADRRSVRGKWQVCRNCRRSRKPGRPNSDGLPVHQRGCRCIRIGAVL